MQVSIETTAGLERRMTICVPAERVETEVDARLKQAAGNVKLPGFRPGKVPFREVRRRYGPSVRQEVAGELMQNTFVEAVTNEKMQPAGSPSLDIIRMEPGQDLEYAATFEVFPEVELRPFSGIQLEDLSAEIADADVDTMIQNLREQRAEFVPVERPAENADQLVIDFAGTIEGEAFDGGSAEGTELLLGSGRMIEGFEAGLVGASAGEERTLELSFPEDYQAEELQGKAVQFVVSVKEVQERQLPAMDDEFFEAFNVEEGGEEAFRAEVRESMERELRAALKSHRKNQVLAGLADSHEVQLPMGLVREELRNVKRQTLQQMGITDLTKFDPDQLPDDTFVGRAERRVLLSLVLRKIIDSKAVSADEDRVKAMVEELAAPYSDPEQVVNYYYSNAEQLDQVRGAVLEDQVVDLVAADATATTRVVSYEDALQAARQSQVLAEQAAQAEQQEDVPGEQQAADQDDAADAAAADAKPAKD